MSGAIVAGVGMSRFVKPGPAAPYPDVAVPVVRNALADAGISYAQLQQAYVGWVYADSTAGQAVLYQLGLSGIPIINVNNNCSTGSTALFLARQAVESGAAECVLALGFEQMTAGPIGSVFGDRPNPIARFEALADARFEDAKHVPPAIRLFGGAGYEYQQRYGASDRTFAEVRAKASRHAAHNERAIFRNTVTAEEVLASPRMFLNLTRLQCCPPTCGAAAAVVCSEPFARRSGLNRRVSIRAQVMTTDTSATFADGSLMKIVGANMARSAAQRAYDAAGVGPEDLDVAELHDCFTTNEVISYEALGLCGEGEAERFVRQGDNTYGGRIVTNPSGGLLCKGHPLGATGLAQCAELVWQLRGEAGPRQVENARLGLQHNLGLGGACVVTIYERAASGA